MNTKNVILLSTTLVCIVQLILRFFMAENLNYSFLIWNLFLAWVPYLISSRLISLRKDSYSATTILPIFISWLLFFPNAPYIITDFIHLHHTQQVPLWFDLLLLTSFAWNGMLLAFLSLRDIHQFLNQFLKENTTWCIIIGILFLSGYGIYLGRIERWNSWDIVTNPMNLMIHIIKTLIDFQLFIKAMSITLFFGMFMTGIYLTVYFFQLKKQ